MNSRSPFSKSASLLNASRKVAKFFLKKSCGLIQSENRSKLIFCAAFDQYPRTSLLRTASQYYFPRDLLEPCRRQFGTCRESTVCPAQKSTDVPLRQGSYDPERGDRLSR